MLPLLHIDDDANDRRLVEHAISLAQTPFLYYGVDCLQAAVPFFDSSGSLLKQHPPPALVLLDYNLGQQTGTDFLYWLRVINQIKSIPVAVFSGSPDRRYVAECYANGADYFITKPADLLRLQTIVQALHRSFLPRRGAPCPVLLLQEYQPRPK